MRTLIHCRVISSSLYRVLLHVRVFWVSALQLTSPAGQSACLEAQGLQLTSPAGQSACLEAQGLCCYCENYKVLVTSQ